MTTTVPGAPFGGGALAGPTVAENAVGGKSDGQSLTRTAALVRLLLRQDRARLVVWTVAIVGMVLATVASVKGLYPTEADLAAAAAVEGNPAAIVMKGPAQGLATVGGRIAFEVGTFASVVVALMSLLMVGRHTRGEEEAGRAELVRAAVVGRHAAASAALSVAAGANLVVAVAVGAG